MDTVSLQYAWWWKCPNCKQDVFSKSIGIEFTDDDLRKQFDLDPWQEIPEELQDLDCRAAPRVVKCKSCGTKYRTLETLPEGGDEEPV